MHRYRILAQIYLTLSVLNLVLAAPIPVRSTQGAEARAGELETGPTGATQNVATRGDGDATSHGSASPPSSPKTMASLEHSPSLDGSRFSGYNPSPQTSDYRSASDKSWTVERPPSHSSKPSLDGSALSHGSHGSESLSKSLPPSRIKAASRLALKTAGIVGAFAAVLWGVSKLQHRDNKDS